MDRTIHRVWIDLDHPGHGLTQYREQFPRRRFPPEVSPDNARAAIFNAESRRVWHWLSRPVTWSAISGIAQELLDKGELVASDVLRCYLYARNEEQLPLGLDWTPQSADPGDWENERSAA